MKKDNMEMLPNHLDAEDISPRFADKFEWWFAHGHYGTGPNPENYFMVAVFRNNLSENMDRAHDGFSLLFSILNADSGKVSFLSQIDQNTINFLKTPEHARKGAHFEALLFEGYRQEVLAYGPPRPLKLVETTVVLTADPFCLSWEDFSIRQSGKNLKICFKDPETNLLCEFYLQPKAPKFWVDQSQSGCGNPMAYVTYPSMKLTGTIGMKKIIGNGWFDHQWGGYGGWFFTPDEQQILGWDWFGINLSDGTDIIIMIHRDLKTLQPTGQFFCIRKGDKIYSGNDFEAVPLRYWRSISSDTVYPVDWEIRIPSRKMKFTISSLADDQEIPIFGYMRTVWEGAGQASGKIGRNKIHGTARIELYGYGARTNFQDYINKQIALIDADVEEFFPKELSDQKIAEYVGKAHWTRECSAYNEVIAQPLWDLMSRNGKHWRPLFGLLMMQALGRAVEDFRSILAIFSELIHTGALIIDDIQDDSLIRRGGPCIHLTHGLDVSINAANTAYFLPYLLISSHPKLTDRQRLEIFKIVAKHAVTVHLGQSTDIYWSKNMSVKKLNTWINDDTTDHKILQMYSYKTAAPIEGITEIACTIANANTATTKKCAEFARDFGVAFQIMDDVNNFSDSPRWKKTCGEDISSGKLTYVIFKSLKLLSAKDNRRLQKILCSEKIRSDQQVLPEAISLIRQSGSLEFCQEKSRELIDHQWGKLSSVLEPSEPKIYLKILCERLLSALTNT